MRTDKMILLPLDGSKASLVALLPAMSLSVFLDEDMHILYVSDETISMEDLSIKLGIKNVDLPRYIIDHKKGDPAEIILEESSSSDYIIMSTHGMTYDIKKLAGSVSIKVIENSSIPVILIKPDTRLNIEEELWKPRKALIPLDGTPGASQALEPAIKILSKTNAEIDLLHISSSKTKPPTEAGTLTAPYYEDYPQYEWQTWTDEFMRRFGGDLGNNHIKTTVFVSKGDPAKEIISCVKQNNNDFIAMAWHGDVGPLHARILKEVILETPCPILLTKIVS